MDFLDNLENSLKSLEAQEERDPAAIQRQQDQKRQTAAIAPWAEKLKSSDYTKILFEKAALAGHAIRAKIYMAWLDSVLRLEVRGRWCELRPTTNGIVAEFVASNGEIKTFPIALEEDPDLLLRKWLESSPD